MIKFEAVMWKEGGLLFKAVYFPGAKQLKVYKVFILIRTKKIEPVYTKFNVSAIDWILFKKKVLKCQTK